MNIDMRFAILCIISTLLLASCESSGPIGPIAQETWEFVRILSEVSTEETIDDTVTVSSCLIETQKEQSCSAGTYNDLSFSGGVSGGTSVLIEGIPIDIGISVDVSSGLGLERGQSQSRPFPQVRLGYKQDFIVITTYTTQAGEGEIRSSVGNETRRIPYSFRAGCEVDIVPLGEPVACRKEETDPGTVLTDLDPANKFISFLAEYDGELERNGIYIIRGNGEDLTHLMHLEEPSCPHWSPDGYQIAFKVKSDDGESIYIVDVRNGNSKQIVSNWPTIWGTMSWNPDGTALAFSGERARSEDQKVYVVELATDKITAVAHNYGNYGYEPIWSPDGEYIAYICEFNEETVNNICLTKPDGTGIRNLTDEYVISGPVVWSPDSSRIAYDSKVYSFDSERNLIENSYLNVINIHSGDLTELSSDDFSRILSQHWSANGFGIFFIASPSNLNWSSPDFVYSLYQINVNSKGVSKIVSETYNPVSLDLSFGDKLITFIGKGDDEDYLYAGPSTGAGLTRLLTGSNIACPQWQP